jgi:putative peptidoglycan lipid II flippase
MNWRKLFKNPIDSIAAAAFIIAITSLTSRLLGIFRDRILAGSFGAGKTLDIYFAAFKIPDLIYNLLVLGALSAGFIPIFINLKKENLKSAWYLANNTLNILLLFLAILSLLGIIFIKPLTSIITPGFDALAKEETARLTMIMFLSPILLGASALIGGILQSFRRFIAYSLAPIFYNLGIIIGALFFVDIWGTIGLAWGVVLGAFLHLLIQIPSAFSLGFRFKFILNLKDRATRKLARLMVPRTLSLAISQINLVVITILATSLETGSLTVFNLANNLQFFPIGIFGISFAIAVFPLLSEKVGSPEKYKEIFSSTMRKILFFIVPATVILITLRAQIIRVILGTGAFTWRDTIMTMNTLGFFALSLFAQASIPLLVRMFYARHDSKTPFYLGLISVALNVVLAILLGNRMGVAGLALAFSIAAIFQFFLLWLRLNIVVGDLNTAKIMSAIFIYTLAALFCGLVVQTTKLAIWLFIDMTTFLGVFIQLTVCASLGLLTYFLICYYLKNPEAKEFLETVKKRLPWKKTKSLDTGEARGL